LSRPQSSIKVLCVGAANIDIRCAFDAPSKDTISNIGNITTMTGGAAFNTARVLTSFDVSTSFCGPVGDDVGQKTICQALGNEKISNNLVTIKGASTGRYISMLEPDGSLKIACNDMKIHDLFDVPRAKAALETELAAKPTAVFCDTNIPQSTLAMIWAKFPDSVHCVTSVSPSKATKLRSMLNELDILFCNVAEAAAILDLQISVNSPETLAKMLAATAAPRGIISNGNHPVLYWENGATGEISVPELNEIVDVTGAGDALAGGILAAFLRGVPFNKAIGNGIAAAGKVLKAQGPWPG